MLATELYPQVDWAEPLEPLPEGWHPLSVSSLEGFKRAMEEGYAAPHDPILHTKLPLIPEDAIGSEAVYDAVEELKGHIAMEQERTGTVVGLAANQIRIPLRLAALALDITYPLDQADRSMTLLANPIVTPLPDPETGTFTYKDTPNGCVNSTLDAFVSITDPSYVQISGWNVTDREPTRYRKNVSDYSAVGWHEVRHLNGKNSMGYALHQNSLSENPRDPDALINWRPVELKEAFKAAVDEDQATDSWKLKVSVSMAQAIGNGTYLQRYYIPNLDQIVRFA